MITKRINPDGSVTIGIIDEENKTYSVDKPEVEKPKAETKKAAPKKSAKKSK